MHQDVWVDFALAWTRPGVEFERGFISQNRVEAGTHLDGAYRGIADALGLDEQRGLARVRELFAPGLALLVHAGVYHPRFGGPTKNRVLNPEIREAVRAVVADRVRLAIQHVPALRAHREARVGPSSR